MWRKGKKEFERSVLRLTTETGASTEKAEKVLRECNGDITLAKEKLQGDFTGGHVKVACPSTSYPDAPPPYSEIAEGAMALPTALPPPYVSHDKGSLFGDTKAQFPSDLEERCCTCFDPIRPDPSEGFSGEVVWRGMKAYHSECYLKSKGPKCEHCCFALIAFPDKGLSGRWGMYNGCKYHEECYVQYAGPRCSACFDVIRFDPENGFSGQWITDGNKQYHEECYSKKLYVEMRAKHS